MGCRFTAVLLQPIYPPELALRLHGLSFQNLHTSETLFGLCVKKRADPSSHLHCTCKITSILKSNSSNNISKHEVHEEEHSEKQETAVDYNYVELHNTIRRYGML